ncbi:MAG: hypothetical protein HC880_12110 [Bacteroidia bacterium]|nr:hypothetical protein [Bacteroidia bacterium]
MAWVLSDDPQAVSFWENWLQEHPGQAATVYQARALVEAFNHQMAHKPYPPALKDEIYQKIRETIQKQQHARSVFFLRDKRPWYAAATISLLLLGSWLLYFS